MSGPRTVVQYLCDLSQKMWRALVYMNWTDRHRHVNKGVTVGNCRMNRLLFADELVLHAWIFNSASVRIWLVFWCVRPSRNENQHWKDWGIVSLKNTQGSAFCKWATAGGDVQVPWGGIHEWRKSEQRDWYRLVKQTQFCVSFIVPRWRNVRFQRTQGFQFLNGFLFRSSPVVMSLRWRLKKYCKKNKRQRWDICEEFSVWHLVTKTAGPKSIKPRMSSYFHESRDPTYVSSAMCPKCPRKEWRNKSFRLYTVYTRGKVVQSWSKDQVAWLHLRLCLVPSAYLQNVTLFAD